VKWIKWIVIVAVAAAGGWLRWQKWQGSRTKPSEYRTAEATRGDITQSVTASGQLNPVLNVQVGSQISGIIQRLYVDYNSSVTQNQVLAELDPATYRAALHQTDAELANAKAGLELAQLNARRAAELRKTDLISVSEHDKAVADLHQAEAVVMLREAAVEKARVDLNRCTILAPTNGIVISRNMDVGQTVAASFSAPTLFMIANDLSKMQIDAMVSEADIGGVEVGQNVVFTVDAFPSRNFEGKVREIRNAPTTNQNVVAYDAVITVENNELKLRPGMTANVSIIIAQHEDVLKIPNAALRFKPPEPDEKGKPRSPTSAPGQRGGQRAGGWGGERGSGGGEGRPPGGFGSGAGPSGRSRPDLATTRTVYLYDPSNVNTNGSPAKPVRVKIGISDGAFTEITEGLNDGDDVIVGLNITQPAVSAPPANPFGGGGMRRF
jgi:HlyD family secretion protein